MEVQESPCQCVWYQTMCMGVYWTPQIWAALAVTSQSEALCSSLELAPPHSSDSETAVVLSNGQTSSQWAQITRN